jgi:Tol biopolymer transport system component
VEVRPARLLFVLGLLALATGCDRKPPTGPSGPPPGPSAPTSTGPIAFVSDRDGTEQIYLANGDGSAVTRLTSGWAPAWSRDGRRLAFNGAQGIYVINVDGSGLRPVARGSSPAWSPDGRMLVFFSGRGVDVVDVDGSNHRTLYDGGRDPAWSPDGLRIAFIDSLCYGFVDGCLWVMNADGSDPRVIVGTSNVNLRLDWSPDGSEIAYVTMGFNLGVVRADGSGQRLVTGQATHVAWTPDGRLIFTRSPTSEVMAPRRRIFISDGGLERQLIVEAAAPSRPDYSDSQATWRR